MTFDHHVSIVEWKKEQDLSLVLVLFMIFDIAPAGPGGGCGDHEDGHQESLNPRHGARTRAAPSL